MLNSLRDHLRRRAPAGLAAAVLGVVVVIGAGSSRAALPSDPAGVPFETFPHAVAAGDYKLACEQNATATLLREITPRPPGRRAALTACARELRSYARDLDEGQLRRLASTRVVKVRFLKPGLARVRVQSTLYGLTLDGATGTAILEDGRWKVAEGASTGTHVGRLLVRTVPSSSMAPTLHPGSTILLDPAAYRHTKPRIGDIVVFHPPRGR